MLVAIMNLILCKNSVLQEFAESLITFHHGARSYSQSVFPRSIRWGNNEFGTPISQRLLDLTTHGKIKPKFVIVIGGYSTLFCFTFTKTQQESLRNYIQFPIATKEGLALTEYHTVEILHLPQPIMTNLPILDFFEQA